MRRSASVRGVVVLALVTAAVGALVAFDARAQSAPIKIGFLTPLTGAFAATGKDMLSGAELYLDEIGRQAAGRSRPILLVDITPCRVRSP